MLRRDALSGNERMPAAHQTTQSVHFGAGALIPLQDVEKEKAAPSTWRPEFAERRCGPARAHCSHRGAGPERATANKPRWRGKNVRCASAICRADPGPLGAILRSVQLDGQRPRICKAGLYGLISHGQFQICVPRQPLIIKFPNVGRTKIHAKADLPATERKDRAALSR